MIKTWFVLMVFGKIGLVAGPVSLPVCIAAAEIYKFQPEPIIIMDGKIVTAKDIKPGCVINPTMPRLGTFDRGNPT